MTNSMQNNPALSQSTLSVMTTFYEMPILSLAN